ncbi:MAG TPA: DUF3801 domain-containing protein [Clostridia bacterium]|nr:DUF3801 domain-containing protein [Clostridia bacterium]
MRVATLSAKGLAFAAALLLKQLRNRQPTGIVSIKNLMKEGDKLLSTDVRSADLEELSKVMKRYNIGIAVMQHGETGDYTVFFKSKTEHQLNAALNAYMAKVFMTFEALNELYFEDMATRLKSTTLTNKRYLFDTKLIPYFGKLSIDKITPAHIRKWQNQMIGHEKGYSPTYLKTTNILLISQRLGHEKVETTWNTYAHLYPDKQEKLAEDLQKFE